MQFKNIYPSTPNMSQRYLNECLLSVGHIVPSVKFLHFNRDLSLKTDDTVHTFSHILHAVYLKCVDFYDTDCMANTIQKTPHL